jgi:putative ABC transport system substrate-binding protein
VIVAPGPEAPLQAARDATPRVPIVMIAINYDPVERGYIASLARPGANITGLFYRQFEVGAKQVELLAQALPAASRFGVLWDTTSADQLKALEVAARTLRIEPMPIEIRSSDDYEAAIATLQRSRVAGVIVAGSPLFFRDRARIHQLLSKHRLPSAGAAGYVDAGPLISYGPDLVHFFSRGADYVDRILRGARPADLPVEQPTRFELTINLRTAKALGVTVPPALLARADTIVE